MNRLHKENSLYLKNSSRQLVDWYPWCEEAFRKAKQEDKPILLDIGAVWCHWCFVMEGELYKDPDIAKVINEYFISIKVDRDERPDIDWRYQQVIGALIKQGGWPLIGFLTPDGDVFFGGSYYSSQDWQGLPPFRVVLLKVVALYRSKKEKLKSDAENLRKALDVSNRDLGLRNKLSLDTMHGISKSIEKAMDKVNGGLGSAPKTFHPYTIMLAIDQYLLNRNQALYHYFTNTLERISRGGVHDQLGGGFYHNSLVENWSIPNFQKLSVVNATLLKCYLRAWQVSGIEYFKETAMDIMQYLNHALCDNKSGGFYACQMADTLSKGNGIYYTWTLEKVRDLLSEDEFEVLQLYFGIHDKGELPSVPDRNILYIHQGSKEIAAELNLEEKRVKQFIESGKKRMLMSRNKRKSPEVDKTIYVDWNGVCISAYLEAYKILGYEPAKDFALRTLDYLLEKAYSKEKGVFHVLQNGKAYVTGLLDDHVQIALACLDAFEVTGNNKYLEISKTVMDRVIGKFWDSKSNGFNDREIGSESLGLLSIRQIPFQDSISASGNACAIQVLDTLYALTHRRNYLETSEMCLKSLTDQATIMGYMSASFAQALSLHLSGLRLVYIVKCGESDVGSKLHQTALSIYHPYKYVRLMDQTYIPSVPMDANVRKLMESSQNSESTMAYLCPKATSWKSVQDEYTLVELLQS